MKIPEQIAEKVINGSFEELYNIFITLEFEYDNFDKEYEDVRFGKDIKFEIQDLWEGTNNIVYKPKSNKVLIYNKAYSITDFRTEKENRRKTMVQAIMDNISEEDMYTPRGEDS